MSKNAVLLILASTVCASVASADSLGHVNLQFSGQGLMEAVGLRYQASFGRTTLRANAASSLMHSFSEGTGAAAALTGELSTFCIDVGQNVATQTASFELVALDAVETTSGRARPLFTSAVVDRLHAVIRSAIDLGYIDARLQRTSASNADNQAAVQLGVWEAIWESSDNSLDLFSRSARSDSYVQAVQRGSSVRSELRELMARANAYLSNRSFDRVEGLMALTNSDFQDQLVVVTVPLPTAGLAGFGLIAGVAGVRRLRR